MRHLIPAVAFTATLALSSTGCLKTMILNGTIEGTRTGSEAFDTIGDYELARPAAQAGLAQFEGMHVLAPDNADALFMLTKGWAGYAFGFVEDEMQAARGRGRRRPRRLPPEARPHGLRPRRLLRPRAPRRRADAASKQAQEERSTRSRSG